MEGRQATVQQSVPRVGATVSVTVGANSHCNSQRHSECSAISQYQLGSQQSVANSPCSNLRWVARRKVAQDTCRCQKLLWHALDMDGKVLLAVFPASREGGGALLCCCHIFSATLGREEKMFCEWQTKQQRHLCWRQLEKQAMAGWMGMGCATEATA